MVDMDALYEAVDELSPEERAQLLEYIQRAGTMAKAPLTQRVFGLHRGMITMSDDFDDKLPDSFWLGEEFTP